MSLLPSLYREVYKIDRVKPTNLRFKVDLKTVHPFADQGRLQQFAQRNGKRLVYISRKERYATFKLRG